jgi:hypothetical protein
VAVCGSGVLVGGKGVLVAVAGVVGGMVAAVGGAGLALPRVRPRPTPSASTTTTPTAHIQGSTCRMLGYLPGLLGCSLTSASLALWECATSSPHTFVGLFPRGACAEPETQCIILKAGTPGKSVQSIDETRRGRIGDLDIPLPLCYNRCGLQLRSS